MGQEVEATVFSREDRQRYRQKVRTCLDVFARMLSESRFEATQGSIGLEIEFNLTDEAGDPALVNAKGIQPLRVHPLPPKIQLEMILPEVLDMERELLAFKTGDRTMLLWEALNSPQTHSYDQAMAVLNDLLDAPELQGVAERYQWPKGW